MAQIQPGAPPSNFFLEGNCSPVAEERDAKEMEVIGSIPTDLQGHFFRVGLNPVHVCSEAAYHTFDGDGMIHAIEFHEGQARYRPVSIGRAWKTLVQGYLTDAEVDTSINLLQHANNLALRKS